MKAVLRQTGLNADNLRAWEKRYQAVKPSRSESGRRVYTETEVQRLSMLADLVRQGHAISKIAQKSDEELLSMLQKSKPSSNASSRVTQTGSAESTEAFLSAMEKFDLPAARVIFGKIRFLTSPRDLVFDLVPRLMFLIGKKVIERKLTISQEHAASEIIQGYMKRVYEDLVIHEGTSRKPKKFLFCTREGDLHDFGLIMAAIACRFEGHHTSYLGRNMPATAMIEAIQSTRPDAIVVGLARLSEAEERVRISDYLEKIDREVRPNVEFWLGGSGADLVRRDHLSRDVWIFETIHELEEKLKTTAPGGI